MNFESFNKIVSKANNIHDNKYTYNINTFVDYHTPFEITCKIHGPFYQSPSGHLYKKSGCPKCHRLTQSKNNSLYKTDVDVYTKSNEVHNYKYTYTHIEKQNSSHIVLTDRIHGSCQTHGPFSQRIGLHIDRKIGCGKCGKIQGSTNNRIGIEGFIKRAQEIHTDINYDYSLVNYINMKTKVDIKCPIHGIFQICPSDMLCGEQGCRLCGLEKSARSRSMTTESFIKRANIVHYNFYDYSMVKLYNTSTKVDIICPKHGKFSMLPNNHIIGEQRCPSCGYLESKMEQAIRRLLDVKQIKYIPQHSFDDLKNINKLRFDFFLPDYNTLIEYDGEFHYMPIFSESDHANQIKRDLEKTKYANQYGYRLLRIPFFRKEEYVKIILTYLNIPADNSGIEDESKLFVEY